MEGELHITPQGNLRDAEGTFQNGNGSGLLELLQKTEKLPEGKLYFRQIISGRIRRLSNQEEPEGRELAAVFAATRPDAAECAQALLAAPPVVGVEYLDAALLLRFHDEFEAALQEGFKIFAGGFAEYLRSLAPAWRNVGKVAFHLAENKGDASGKRPFAFLASYIHRTENERPRHLPLATALKAYANDREALKAVLAPIVQVADGSTFIRDLLESRRIFQPIALGSAQAYTFLKEIPLYEDANILVRINKLWKNKPPRAKMVVTVGSRNTHFDSRSLLDFKAEICLDGEALTDEEVAALLKAEDGLVRIRNQWVVADAQTIAGLLAKWKEAREIAHAEGLTIAEGLRLLAGAEADGGLSESNGTAEQDCVFRAGGELKRLLDDMGEPSSISIPRLPDSLETTLRGYQAVGVGYLWRATTFGLGVCLADDMGLGKTLQLLAVFSIWKNTGVLDKLPALLVLPATLLANWRSEAAKFTPWLKLVTLHNSSMDKREWGDFKENPCVFLSRFDVALVTYGMLSRLGELAKLDFPAVVADEAQAIKNPGSSQSRTLRSIHGARRIAMTGTPVENRLSDLWSIFDFINPGLLGSLRSFQKFSKGLEEDYSPLRKLTKPFILRRLKTDKRIIADLSDKTEVNVFCGLSKKQAALYSKCVDDMKHELETEDESIRRRGLVLAYLMRFKQICNHPDQYLGLGAYAPADSGKFQRLAEIVEVVASRQEKMLVFTQFREMTGPIADFLAQCFGKEGLVLHGGTPVKERSRLVADFQREDGPPFFVLSLKAAGTGLNLTAASHVVHFDRWWNPAVENQASDRAFRIGQKRNVLVHKFLCKGTLEEKIDELIIDKQSMADELLHEGAEKLVTAMGTDELVSLVSLNAEAADI
ncbi:MAG: DEAD/DEAH box helicase [Lentisphaeria bacterium]|nr:DEAD/DEAH box helicase [Lentisphaeria bacterium]